MARHSSVPVACTLSFSQCSAGPVAGGLTSENNTLLPEPRKNPATPTFIWLLYDDSRTQEELILTEEPAHSLALSQYRHLSPRETTDAASRVQSKTAYSSTVVEVVGFANYATVAPGRHAEGVHSVAETGLGRGLPHSALHEAEDRGQDSQMKPNRVPQRYVTWPPWHTSTKRWWRPS